MATVISPLDSATVCAGLSAAFRAFLAQNASRSDALWPTGKSALHKGPAIMRLASVSATKDSVGLIVARGSALRAGESVAACDCACSCVR